MWKQTFTTVKHANTTPSNAINRFRPYTKQAGQSSNYCWTTHYLTFGLSQFYATRCSASQEKSGVIIPTTISSQHDHTSCSALIDTGSAVTLLSEKIQCQLSYPATPLESHYKLLRATGETLTTLGTVQVDILFGRKVWTTPAIVASSLTLWLDTLTVDFETNTVETGSTLYPTNTHYTQSSNSTIIIPKSNFYRPCRLMLNKKDCWMIALMLAIVIILTAVPSHTLCHFNPPFKKRNKPLVSSERNLTW